jgi:hypothetical protein
LASSVFSRQPQASEKNVIRYKGHATKKQEKKARPSRASRKANHHDGAPVSSPLSALVVGVGTYAPASTRAFREMAVDADAASKTTSIVIVCGVNNSAVFLRALFLFFCIHVLERG